MKRLWKKIIVLILSLAAFLWNLFALEEKLIKCRKFPSKAKRFIQDHFINLKITYIILNDEWVDKDCEVRFENGNTVKFNNNGEWTQIQCTSSQVPQSAIPCRIRSYLTNNYGRNIVMELLRAGKKYVVIIDTGAKITFDHEYNVESDDA